MGKAILFSAPSGCGKTTIIKELMQYFDCFEFSVSATSRAPRGEEVDGRDYYFLSREEFMRRVERDEFLEWEEVYQGTCYGTLKSEVERIWNKGGVIVFDVDVNGGRNIKRYFGADALSIFVLPPSMEVLEQRLRSRGTDSEEAIVKRLARSAEELKQAPQFDVTIVNDDLQRAVQETRTTIEHFLSE
ncbi:MAG: guanylate kinase [Bacteroidales bacterium]|nr:guanylate kinase [Bacteroidales bacterium]MBR5093318.1 guanylate kinase [Bacteroidales bacterium]